MMTLSTKPHSQPTAPTARPPLANQPEVRGCLQPAHQSNWNGVATGLSTTSGFISTHTGLQGFNRYSYCTNNPLKYTDPSGYRRKPDGWDQPWVALNGAISPGGRMGPGSGKHWSDGFRSEWGNFMLGNQGAYDGMYGLGAYNNFVNNVYPKEKKQTSHDDRLLMHFVGFKWNPVGGVEVERGGDDGDLRIYCSGSWQKKDGRPEEDDPAGQGGWDSNGDGKLQKNEADNHWLHGGGVDIWIDNSKIDWTGLKIPVSAKVGKIFSISTTRAFLELPYETAATYGGTSFILRGPHSVEVVDQLYHYNYRPNNSAENIMRNFMNWYGKPDNQGRDYIIHYINPLIIIK